MAADAENDEVFDEEELAEGFDEEIVGDEIDDELVDDVIDSDEEADVDTLVTDVIVEEADDEIEELKPEVIVADDDDDVIDDADVELALDEVLAETILRTSITDDDEDGPVEVDPNLENSETILPKQDDEFRCLSCRLLKKTSQLANRQKMLCRDCV
ncbi:MAG TPA: DUF4193 family protein [Acidimicrobiales bacterium]|nr:DUF4193 family protein [Acidimicrobiales bacterium]